MTDATSRARSVIALTEIPADHYDRSEYVIPMGHDIADAVLADLRNFGLALYDTRTHAAVAREPSDEVVERVARAIVEAGDKHFGSPRFKFEGDEVLDNARARAAIAALVGGQTQGGEE